MEFATYLINVGWWYCLSSVYMWLMLLPEWQMELPFVNRVKDGYECDVWQME